MTSINGACKILLRVNLVSFVMSQAQLDPEEVLVQFNRLMRELLRGQINRNTFQPWEIELLLDIENCTLKETTRESTLKRYQKAVQRQLLRGGTVPLKLSEFLRTKSKKKAALS